MTEQLSTPLFQLAVLKLVERALSGTHIVEKSQVALNCWVLTCCFCKWLNRSNINTGNTCCHTYRYLYSKIWIYTYIWMYIFKIWIQILHTSVHIHLTCIDVNIKAVFWPTHFLWLVPTPTHVFVDHPQTSGVASWKGLEGISFDHGRHQSRRGPWSNLFMGFSCCFFQFLEHYGENWRLLEVEMRWIGGVWGQVFGTSERVFGFLVWVLPFLESVPGEKLASVSRFSQQRGYFATLCCFTQLLICWNINI